MTDEESSREVSHTQVRFTVTKEKLEAIIKRKCELEQEVIAMIAKRDQAEVDYRYDATPLCNSIIM